jgi:hypothetical protein
MVILRAVIRMFKGGIEWETLVDCLLCGFTLVGRGLPFESILGSLYGIKEVAALWRIHWTYLVIRNYY